MGHNPLTFNILNVISECTTCLKLAEDYCMSGTKDGSEKQESMSPVATITLILEYFGTLLYGGCGTLFVQGLFSWKTEKDS